MMRGLAVRSALVAAATTGLLAHPPGRPAPLSIEDLRGRQAKTSLQVVRALDEGPSFTAQLVSYRSGTLPCTRWWRLRSHRRRPAASLS